MLNELFHHAARLPEETDPDVVVAAWEAVMTHPGFAAMPPAERWSTLAALGLTRIARYDRDARLEDLAAALTHLESALALPGIPPGHRAIGSFTLGRAQERRYRLTNGTDDLLTTARTMWSLVDDPPRDTSARALCRWVCRLIEEHTDEPAPASTPSSAPSMEPPLTRPVPPSMPRSLLRLRSDALERLLRDPSDPDLPRYQLSLALSIVNLFDASPAAHRAQVARAVGLAMESERLLPEGPERRYAAELVLKLRRLQEWVEENAPEGTPGEGEEPGRMDVFAFVGEVTKVPDHDTRVAKLRETLAMNPYETAGDAWVVLSTALAEEILSVRTNGPIDTDEAITLLRGVLDLPETVEFGVGLEIRHNLAVAYTRRRAGDPAANTAAALELLEHCLAQAPPDHPRRAAFVISLAQSLVDDADRTDRRDSVDRAIGLCRTTLDALPADADREIRAGLLGVLARLLPSLTTGEPEQNIEDAIAAARAALDLLDPVTDAVRRGDVHHNLARLYRDRLAEGREANLWRAIEHYRASLVAQPKETMPMDWAMSQTSLGVAYSMMRGRDVEATQRLAVAAFMDALSVLTLADQPELWASAEFSLGVALGDAEVRAEPDLERAIVHLTSCLQVFTEASAPRQWALTQSFLGAMRMQTRVPAQLTAAAAHFRAALRVLTFENNPREWATVRLNLAQLEPSQDRVAHEKTIKLLIERGQRTDAYRACLLYLRMLSDAGDLPAAADAGARAAELHESLYQEALLRQSRHMEQHAAAEDVMEIVTAMVAAGRTLDAVLLLERTRARELGEILQQDEEALRRARDADSEAYDAYRAADARLAQLGAAEQSVAVSRFGTGDLERLQSTLVRAIATARAERDAALARLTVAVEPLGPPGIGELSLAAPPHRPLVYVYVSHGTARLLLVRRDAEGSLDIDVRTADVRDVAPEEDPVAALQDRIVGELAAWLRGLRVTEVTLVACGPLAGVPLHAVAHDGRCLVDEFTVSFAPSAALLARRPRSRPGPTALAAVGDPTDDLGFAWAEAAAAVALGPWSRYTLRQGTAATASVFLKEDLPGATHVHLACHGLFDPATPLESAFLLARDTRITLREIMARRAFRGVRLVFASACGTASTDRFLPDEAIGLASGLLQAGAAEVIASLWNVQDLPTMLLATRFYHELPSGTGQALRAAQLWLRDSTAGQLSRWCGALLDAVDEPARSRLREAVAVLERFPQQAPCYADPRFWAAFIHLGG
ncbi:CHAT domain-containing protein [Streptomyces sp. NPDC002138]|uniref:CHAT domain-containing protein n=1 Tax=Streptomyces sp. NPDC002138 TaxID=3154410 RepID=UPI003333DB89